MDKATLERKGYSVPALRALARKQLPRLLFDLVDGAAGDEITMRRNEAALAAMELVPTLLAGAPTRDQSVELFGFKLPSPVIIGPTGFAGLLWPRAEIETARAAARFGTIYSTSHASMSTLEEIAGATQGPKWMQTFLYKDRGLTAEFAARAAAAGYRALILTVDNQVVAGRDRDARNGASFPLRWSPRRVIDFASRPGWLMRMRATPSPSFANYGARSAMAAFGPLMVEQLDPDIGWHDVDWLRNLWRGPLILKGILHPDEAREAVKRGADGIIVSNHGGRQLDGAVASIRALPGIVEAVGGKAPVLVDGGFRRGIDVVKALALGATRGAHRAPASLGRRLRRRGRRLLDARAFPARDRPGAGARRLGRSGQAEPGRLLRCGAARRGRRGHGRLGADRAPSAGLALFHMKPEGAAGSDHRTFGALSLRANRRLLRAMIVEEMTRRALPTATGFAAARAIAALKARKIDPAPLLRRAGLKNPGPEDQPQRVSAAAQSRLLEYAAEALDDSALGLHLAEQADPRDAGILFYITAGAKDVNEAVALFVRYCRIVNEATRVKLARTSEGVAIEFHVVGVPRHSARQNLEFGLAVYLKGLREITGRHVRPIRAAFVPCAQFAPAGVRAILRLPGRVRQRLERGRRPISWNSPARSSRCRSSTPIPSWSRR